MIGSKGNKKVEKIVAERGVTLLKNENILPMDITGDKRVLFISETKARGSIMESEIKKISKNVVVEKIATNYNMGLSELLKSGIKNSDYIILTTYNLKNNTKINKIIEFANKNDKKLVTISTRNPYDIIYTPTVKANIVIYGITGFDRTNNSRNSLEANIRAGIRTIFIGKDKNKLVRPVGKLPVDIRDEKGEIIFKFGTGLTY